MFNEDKNKGLVATLTPKQENSVAYYNLGEAYYGKGQYHYALLYCTEAIELDPENANAYMCRGNALRQIGDDYLAIKDFTNAFLLKQDYFDSYIGKVCADLQIDRSKYTEEMLMDMFWKMWAKTEFLELLV